MTTAPATRTRAYDMRAAGMTYPQIARELGLCATTVATLVKAHCAATGVAMPPTPPNPASRRGNGAGSGNWASGPAKGLPPRAPTHPEFEVGNSVAAGIHDMSDAEKSAQLKAMYLDLAMGSHKPLEKIAAGEAWHDRTFGKAKAHTELTGKDGGPLMNAVVQYQLPNNGRD